VDLCKFVFVARIKIADVYSRLLVGGVILQLHSSSVGRYCGLYLLN